MCTIQIRLCILWSFETGKLFKNPYCFTACFIYDSRRLAHMWSWKGEEICVSCSRAHLRLPSGFEGGICEAGGAGPEDGCGEAGCWAQRQQCCAWLAGRRLKLCQDSAQVVELQHRLVCFCANSSPTSCPHHCLLSLCLHTRRRSFPALNVFFLDFSATLPESAREDIWGQDGNNRCT